MIPSIFNNMTRTELRNLAVQLNVPRGRNKEDTQTNLQNAILEGKAFLKSVVTITAKPVPPLLTGQVLLIKNFKTY